MNPLQAELPIWRGSYTLSRCLHTRSYIVVALPLKEQLLISRIRHAIPKRTHAVSAGIGDDCAILRVPASHETLVTTDFSLEGMHFRREWHSPDVVGHRSLTRGLSDIAAMGAMPIAAFLSLALPRDLPQRWVNRFLKGLLHLAREFDVVLAGGDTAESPNGILADIVVVGSVPKGQAIRRSGARPGDRIYVTGLLGGSAATLEWLQSGKNVRPKYHTPHFHPTPRIAVGRALREKGLASAMIDISDGLSTDLHHVCEESGVGAEIQAGAIPLAKIGRPAQKVDLRHALHGGEDYELLFTAKAGKTVRRRIAGVPVHEIGKITRSKNVLLVDKSGRAAQLRPAGWQHFGK